MTERKWLVFSFADVQVREREFCILRNGKVLPVEPKAFRVLLFLLRNPQKLITKEELLDAVWSDTAVSENSLTRSIALLRRLLGDDTHEPRYIATVPTVGYRFLCDVKVAEDGFAGGSAAKSNPMDHHVGDQYRLLHRGYWGHFAVTEAGIYLLDVDAAPRPTIMYYSFQTRQLTPVLQLEEHPLPWEPNLSASRDGRTLLVTQGLRQSSIIMAENF